jgi:hypothetical protein
MKRRFSSLHLNSKFNILDLKNTPRVRSLFIINVGQYLELSDPDFFNADLIQDQKGEGKCRNSYKIF